MRKQPILILAAFALVAFTAIYRPIIEYLFPDMYSSYAVLLRKGLQAMTVIIYITAMKLWGNLAPKETAILPVKRQIKGLLPLFPVIILSFSPYLYGFKDQSIINFNISILICLLIGVIEELTYRGIIYSALRPYGVPAAVIISSAVFAFIHLPNMFYGKSIEDTLYQIVFAFGFGLIMAYIRHKTGLLLPQLLVHALWDFNVRICDTSLTIPLADTINFISEICIIIIGLALMIIVVKENRRQRPRPADNR